MEREKLYHIEMAKKFIAIYFRINNVFPKT